MIISLSDKAAGKQVMLPGSICVEKQYGCVRYKNYSTGGSGTLQITCNLPFEEVLEIRRERMCVCMDVIPREKLMKEIPRKDYTKWFDYDKIKNGICLRNPMEGDYFIMDSSGNRKRLSRYYIDEKIPVSERKQEIVLADGDHVIWAVPGRISNAYKVTEETRQVLVVMMTLN